MGWGGGSFFLSYFRVISVVAFYRRFVSVSPLGVSLRYIAP